MKRSYKILITCLLLLAVFVGSVVAQRIRKHGALIDATSTGGIVLTPATGQGVAIGGGTAIKKVLSASASLDFGATAAGACDALTITVTGAASGDVVSLGIPAALAAADAYQGFWGYVSAANTVTVKRCNPINATTALSNPAAATVRVQVNQF
jgi:hypothetical protein